MANVVATVQIMPESPSVDLAKIEAEAKKRITKFAGKGDMRSVQEPIAFGLKALKITFIMNEAQGSTEPLEKDLSSIPGVNSVEVIDVRRAVG